MLCDRLQLLIEQLSMFERNRFIGGALNDQNGFVQAFDDLQSVGRAKMFFLQRAETSFQNRSGYAGPLDLASKSSPERTAPVRSRRSTPALFRSLADSKEFSKAARIQFLD